MIQIGKEEVNVSLFTDDMILYKKKSLKIQLRNTFSKVAGYKTNTQKSVIFNLR